MAQHNGQPRQTLFSGDDVGVSNRGGGDNYDLLSPSLGWV